MTALAKLPRTPQRPITRIYRVGAEAPAMTFWGTAHQIGWSIMREDIAAFFECEPEEVDTFDAYWGGEYGDDNSADVITVSGQIVATFNKPISAADLAQIIGMKEAA